jgi:uncharacterized low-complexity protein
MGGNSRVVTQNKWKSIIMKQPKKIPVLKDKQMSNTDPSVSLAMIGIMSISVIAALTAQSTEAATLDPFLSQPVNTVTSSSEHAQINQLKTKKQADGGCGAGSCAAKLNKAKLKPLNNVDRPAPTNVDNQYAK